MNTLVNTRRSIVTHGHTECRHALWSTTPRGLCQQSNDLYAEQLSTRHTSNESWSHSGKTLIELFLTLELEHVESSANESLACLARFPVVALTVSSVSWKGQMKGAVIGSLGPRSTLTISVTFGTRRANERPRWLSESPVHRIG